MKKCVKDFTIINSQPSIEALENLMEEFFSTFRLMETIDDIFYYGVFCKPQNYANYYRFDEDYDFEIPFELTAECATEDEKIDFVLKTMKQIMRKEITKPEWMKYVEMNMICNEYGQPPSTFLRIMPKDIKYEALAEKLIEFLYSPNLTITMVEA